MSTCDMSEFMAINSKDDDGMFTDEEDAGDVIDGDEEKKKTVKPVKTKPATTKTATIKTITTKKTKTAITKTTTIKPITKPLKTLFRKWFAKQDTAEVDAGKVKNKFMFKNAEHKFTSAPDLNKFIEVALLDDDNNYRKDNYYHEIIPEEKPIRLCADIDGTGKFDVLVVMNCFRSLLVDAFNVMLSNPYDKSFERWSTSSTNEKLSLHFTYTGYYFENRDLQNTFWLNIRQRLLTDIKYDDLHDGKKCLIDFQLYNRNHTLRTIYSTKPDVDRCLLPLKLTNKTYEDPDKIPTIIKIEPRGKIPIKAIEHYFVNIHDINDDMIKFAYNPYDEDYICSKPVSVCDWIIPAHSDDLISIIRCGLPGFNIKCTATPNIYACLRQGGKCPIADRTHLNNNSYCVVTRRGILFKCHSQECKGKSHPIPEFERIEGVSSYNIDNVNGAIKERLVPEDEKANVSIIKEKQCGLAQHFIHLHGDLICHGENETYFYNEEVALWSLLKSKHTLTGMIIRKLKTWLDTWHLPSEHQQYKLKAEMWTWLNSVSSNKILAMVLQNAPVKNFRQIIANNVNSHLLPIANKNVIDLKTGQIRQRKPLDYFQSACDINIDIDKLNKGEYAAGIEIIKKFMSDLMLDNQDLIKYLQVILGYCLTGTNDAKKLFIFYGPHGNNGKTTLIEGLMGRILGNFYMPLERNLIIQNNKSSDSNHQANLIVHMNKRISYLAELKDEEKVREDIVKPWTGNDGIFARNAGEASTDSSKYVSNSKIIISTNKPLVIDWTDKAMYNRIVYVPFNMNIVNTQDQIKDASYQKLKDENFINEVMQNMPAFLVWLMEGAKLYYAGEINNPPKECIKVKQQIAKSQDTIKAYTEDRIKIQTDNKKMTESLSDIFTDYKRYCKDNALTQLSDKIFYRDFQTIIIASGGVRYMSNGRPRIRYVSIIADEDEDASEGI